MATLFWLYAKYIMQAQLRTPEILIMLMIDGYYGLVFWAIKKMGNDGSRHERKRSEKEKRSKR